MKKCLCGQETRRGQRDCLKCHAASVKRSRRKRDEELRTLKRMLEELTLNNSVTQARFDQSVGSRWVVVTRDDGEGNTERVTGYAYGFLPDGKVKVVTADGETFIVGLSELLPDRTR